MDTGNACVDSTKGSPLAYLAGYDNDHQDSELEEMFRKETEAHTLTIDLRVIRMEPVVEGKRINPTAVFNKIIGEDSVDDYYNKLVDVLEAVAEQVNSVTPLQIFAFGGVPHAKMKSLLKDRVTNKLMMNADDYEMHPEALISGRGLRNLEDSASIEEIVAKSTTVCSREEAYLRSDRALQQRLKGLGINIKVNSTTIKFSSIKIKCNSTII